MSWVRFEGAVSILLTGDTGKGGKCEGGKVECGWQILMCLYEMASTVLSEMLQGVWSSINRPTSITSVNISIESAVDVNIHVLFNSKN